MARTVTHLSLHRIAGTCHSQALGSLREPEGTELRVVADVEGGVLQVAQIEEEVIRGYARQQSWPHRWVTLFILQDLQPLIRQIEASAGSAKQVRLPAGDEPRRPEQSRVSLPPGGTAALESQPVINVYDLADPGNCNVFVNRQAMLREGYWDDPLAIQALLAHEHAHPLAENETVRASRHLQLDLSLDSEALERQARAMHLLALLAEKLCVYAPREIYANELTIRSGFGDALFHLDQLNVANAARSVAGREGLYRQLQQEVVQGALTPAAADLLLLVGDMTGYLDLALEVAPFYRAGRENDARYLEADLGKVFPHLKPQVPKAYTALREQYVVLPADLPPAGLVGWGEKVLNELAEALADTGFDLQFRLRTVAGREAQERDHAPRTHNKEA